MADVSKIKLGATTYNIKDASAKHTVTTSTTTIKKPTAGTAIPADDITAWTTNTPTTITYTARSIPNVTNVGSVPSLTYTARSIPNVTAAGTASIANGILTITNTTLGTAIAADDITAWSAGSTPTLGTAISADDITAYTAGTAASLSYTAKSIPNISLSADTTVVTDVTAS